jgi:hypothetical protein
MAKWESIDSEIGFSDGEVTSYSKADDNLLISVKAWNDKFIKIVCKDVIGFLDKGTWDISDFREIKSETVLLREVLERQFENIPEDHGYKAFHFVDNDNQAVMEIVCLEINITAD